jgi:hypothetical protein
MLLHALLGQASVACITMSDHSPGGLDNYSPATSATIYYLLCIFLHLLWQLHYVCWRFIVTWRYMYIYKIYIRLMYVRCNTLWWIAWKRIFQVYVLWWTCILERHAPQRNYTCMNLINAFWKFRNRFYVTLDWKAKLLKTKIWNKNFILN